jgi:hypothetical protein
VQCGRWRAEGGVRRVEWKVECGWRVEAFKKKY